MYKNHTYYWIYPAGKTWQLTPYIYSADRDAFSAWPGMPELPSNLVQYAEEIAPPGTVTLRAARFDVTAALLINVLGLPKDVRLLAVSDHRLPDNGTLHCTIAHPCLPMVREGDMIPEILPMLSVSDKPLDGSSRPVQYVTCKWAQFFVADASLDEVQNART